MDALMIARLQFATTASIHFLFVMVTLGLVTLVVGFQTAWVITKKPVYERLTRFWGLLYVINYILGIATGIVMEFQFGLNWSGLSHYLGNVFGAPLAMETLVAFFLESTFLGMWIFGWHRLRKGVHLALIWLVAFTAYLFCVLDHGGGARLVLPALVALAAAAAVGMLSARVRAAVQSPLVAVLVLVAIVAALLAARVALARRRPGLAFAATALTLALPVLLVLGSTYPYALAPDLTVEAVTAAPATLRVLNWLALPLIPALVGFQMMCWWAFRGRIDAKGPMFY